MQIFIASVGFVGCIKTPHYFVIYLLQFGIACYAKNRSTTQKRATVLQVQETIDHKATRAKKCRIWKLWKILHFPSNAFSLDPGLIRYAEPWFWVGALDPIPAAITRRSSPWLWHVRDTQSAAVGTAISAVGQRKVNFICALRVSNEPSAGRTGRAWLQLYRSIKWSAIVLCLSNTIGPTSV